MIDKWFDSNPDNKYQKIRHPPFVFKNLYLQVQSVHFVTVCSTACCNLGVLQCASVLHRAAVYYRVLCVRGWGLIIQGRIARRRINLTPNFHVNSC